MIQKRENPAGLSWQPRFDEAGNWTWATDYLPNGWCACVADCSQSRTPPEPTVYDVSAICKWHIVSHPATFQALGEAKSAALDLVIRQGEARESPKCKVEWKQ